MISDPATRFCFVSMRYFGNTAELLVVLLANCVIAECWSFSSRSNIDTVVKDCSSIKFQLSTLTF